MFLEQIGPPDWPHVPSEAIATSSQQRCQSGPQGHQTKCYACNGQIGAYQSSPPLREADR